MVAVSLKNIFFLLFFVVIAQVEAQRFMMLQKGANQKTRIKYEEGDVLVYQSKENDFFISDQILEIHRDFLVLKENILRPEDIVVVDIENRDERNRTLQNLSWLMYAGGGTLLTAETINGLYHDKKLTYSRVGLIISGSLIATGYILSRVKYRYFKHEKRNKIQIIYLDDNSDLDE